MNNKAVSLIKNFSYTFTSNLISMIVSVLIILILPKVLGLEEYGYFQLFIFYASYVGIFHFGWSDGIYLRYGGLHYKELNSKLFTNQFVMLVLFQALISLIIVITSNLLIDDDKRLFIIYMISLLLVIVNSRYMIIHILQATNRIKEFAKITLLEKIIFIILILSFIMLDKIDFKFFIIADVIGKVVSLLIGIYYCKEILFYKNKKSHFNFYETFQNINAGYKLMLANITGMLILGVVRFGIERSWDIATFGKVSLTLSISSFLMIFVSAIGVVIFPILKRINDDELLDVYNMIRHFLGASLLLILIIFFPLKTGLLYWLPDYKESLIYMALIFPMIIFEGKTVLLTNTYLKVLRKEKIMLIVNLLSLLLSILLTVLFTIFFKNLELSILAFLVVIAFKSILAEILLVRYLKTKVSKDILLEVLITISFIIFSWYLDTSIAFAFYFLVYLTYLLIKRKELYQSFNEIKRIIEK
ncbi:oligosaccharide flippase family protein [Paenisporosarcina sp. TG20]|uniref:oligosaccharide flippase family protein n=1 Tax=Paenisporosarcina sp. TG20 TaxID=1211706 RepID=UPI00031E924A|nr:oligosaccharide flippase family protein [Paenisporosarcina sp. TG20]